MMKVEFEKKKMKKHMSAWGISRFSSLEFSQSIVADECDKSGMNNSYTTTHN